MGIQTLFEGQEISDDLKTAATAIIETEIENGIKAKTQSLQESYDAALAEAIETKVIELEESNETYRKEILLPNIKNYLGLAITEWAEDNKVALESGLKVIVAEEFMESQVKGISKFAVAISESGSDQLDKITELSEEVNALLAEKLELSEQIKTYKKKEITESLCKTLSENEKDKIQEYIDKLNYVNESQFEEAAKRLVKSFYPENKQAVNESDLNEATKQHKLNESNDEPSTKSSYLDHIMKSFD